MKILKLEKYEFEIGETVIIQNVVEIAGKWNGEECKIVYKMLNYVSSAFPNGYYRVEFKGHYYGADPNQIRKK